MPASAIPREARNARRSARFRPGESTNKRETFLAVTFSLFARALVV